jgi:integrase/recombinase XerD
MFERLFRLPAVLARHRDGPFAKERERFLQHCAEEGTAMSTLSSIADYLLAISQRLNVDADGYVTEQHVLAAAVQWKRYQRRRGRSHGPKARQRFIQIASDWLRFLGRLPTPEPERFIGLAHLRDFMVFMQEERGLSVYTIRNRQKIITRFLKAFAVQQRAFSTVAVADIDNHLESLGSHKWCRASIASSARALRSFFRYAGEKGWCSPTVSLGIQGPRIFKQEGLAVGPAWNEVEQLILSAGGNTARDIRDQAILRLLATYGLRRGEVSRLRLGDIDWDHDRLLVRRPKQGCAQEYPLLPSVGDAIVRYLQHARPKSLHGEIFLTLRAPIAPLSGDGLYDVVYSRLRALGASSLHRGPHALRHACAGRLVAQGLSLKEIGDHLGHRSASATRIYAKVDLAGLREVATFGLGDLL